MLDTQLNLLGDVIEAESPATAMSNNRVKVEKIWVSRGDDTYDHYDRLADRFAGVLIEGEIFWINKTFATFGELAHILRPLNIRLFGTGEWGNIKCDNDADMSNTVVKVKKRHNEFFSDDSMYLKKAKFFNEGMIWWYPDDIVAHFENRFSHCDINCNCNQSQ